jgi:Rps23 Pro-64 3,4-dihydroxylase Tpa1-like proline 4-hydroxylase
MLNLNNLVTEYKYDCLIFKVNNFLNETTAMKIYNVLLKLPDKYWINMSGFDTTKDESRIIKKNIKKIKYFNKKAISAFSKGNFSFNFHKTFYAKQTLFKIFNSYKFISYINNITKNKFNLTKLTSIFISRYKTGHFLSPHSDKNNGKIGFVINLSRNWKPHYGGNLHIMDKSRENVIYTFTPSFNNLIFFEIPPENGIPHFVSHVSPSIKNMRFAVTGWLS